MVLRFHPPYLPEKGKARNCAVHDCADGWSIAGVLKNLAADHSMRQSMPGREQHLYAPTGRSLMDFILTVFALLAWLRPNPGPQPNPNPTPW